MCRNIKPLFNFQPSASEAEIREASLQYVRKISGFRRPSRANAAAFDLAVEAIAQATGHLLESLEPTTTPRSREVEAARAHERALRRFGKGMAS